MFIEFVPIHVCVRTAISSRPIISVERGIENAINILQISEQKRSYLSYETLRSTQPTEHRNEKVIRKV